MAQSNSTIFGPAILVTAAFIGPGTVMAASTAGAKYGYQLLWAVAFSVFGAIVLQEMAARLGIVTGAGLSQAIKRSFSNAFLKVTIIGLVLAAILVGNAAYQTGNILGAASGMLVLSEHDQREDDQREDDQRPSQSSTENDVSAATSISPTKEKKSSTGLTVWILIIGGLAWALILIGRFEVLQKVLTLLVILMSSLFLLAAILSSPNLSALFSGLIPSIPQGGEWFVIGLIGTTIVPYNLFLHASAAAQRWPADSVRKTDDKLKAVRSSRRDTIKSILVGGAVTGAILVTAATAFYSEDGDSTQLTSVKDVAIQLKPALGSWAKWLFGAGLFAAGLTSAITAPIAAAYAAAGCFDWPNELSDWRLKGVASVVVLCGVLFATLFGASPAETIVLAQVANGLLLPILAIFLLVILNRVSLMHRFRNNLAANVLGIIIVIVVTLIAARTLGKAYDKIQGMLNPTQSANCLIEVWDKPIPVELDKSNNEIPIQSAIIQRQYDKT